MAFLHKKLVRDTVPGFFQTVVNQLCGLAIFLVLSVQLDKAAFGEINWTLAVLLTSFAVLGFGIDQLVVKKIAAGSNSNEIISLYLLHVLLTGCIFYAALFLGHFLFPSFFNKHYFLLWLAIGKLAVFIASIFRQLANGREEFRLLAVMMIISNVLRALALLLLWGLNLVNTATVVWVFIAGDIAELITCWLLARTRFRLQLSLARRWQQYRLLLKESLPQLGSTILAAVASRMDWILMGLMGMSVQLADYSFAYKIFEMSMLPLAVIGTVLIPRFVRMFNSPVSNLDKLFTLVRLEMVFAAATAMVLCILWVPVIDELTRGRYGAVNNRTILWLAAAIPFLYLNNLLWTVLFAKGHLRQILWIMLVVFLFNLAGNILLIPRYSGQGAAVSWLAAAALQSVLMLAAVNIKRLTINTGWLLFCILCATGTAYAAMYFFSGTVPVVAVAVLLYLLLMGLSGALRRSDMKMLQ